MATPQVPATLASPPAAASRRLGRLLALADTAGYRRVLAAWLTLFLAGFALLPGEPVQRALFYGALPLTLPAAVAAARDWRPGRLAAALAAFLFWLGLSGLWSDQPDSFGKTIWKAIAIALFLLVCVAVGRNGPAAWRRALRTAAVLAAVVAVGELALHLADCATCRFIGFGRHANANYTASVAGALTAMAAASVLSSPGRRGALVLPALLPLLGLLVATGSRAALLACLGVVALCAGLVASRGRHARLAAGVLAAGLAAVTGAAAWLGPAWLAAEIARGDTYRVGIWREDIARFLERPWLGHGGEAPDVFRIGGEVVGFHAHNLWLAQAFYGGAVAAVLWTAVVVAALAVGLRAWRRAGDVLPLAGLGFLLIVGMVDMGPVLVDVQAIWLYAWVPLGLALSYEAAERAAPALPAAPVRRAITAP